MFDMGGGPKRKMPPGMGAAQPGQSQPSAMPGGQAAQRRQAGGQGGPMPSMPAPAQPGPFQPLQSATPADLTQALVPGKQGQAPDVGGLVQMLMALKGKGGVL